ncbi:MAG: protoheme IX farnesyltransferase [Rickettsiaceae bacterium]|nr:MAG: protoheme IX farnesyltransferase [Rickettsiaceae bacterium]
MTSTNHTLESKFQSNIKDYIALMKPRVMSLVVFTSFCGLVLAPGHIHPFLGFVAILCISLSAGAAAVINMWYDRDIDAVMKRTNTRPIVRGAIDPDDALSFGVVLGFMASLLMALCINIMAAIILSFTLLYYIFVYTIWLKRSSPQNIVIGGVSGALPPLIGWVAVTGQISIEPVVLSMLIFMWTPPHSWALALYRIDDYKNCKVPMMPIIKGELHTKRLIVLYSVLMIIISVVPYFLGVGNLVYLATALLLGLIFFHITIRLFNDRNNNKAKKLFTYSIFYLFALFMTLLVKPILDYSCY